MKLNPPAVSLAASVLAASAALLSPPTAHAQTQAGIYGMFTAQHLASLSYTTVGNNTTGATSTQTNGSISPIGGILGGFYNFRSLGPVRLGVDVRGSIGSTNHGADPSSAGTGGRLYLGMGGLRATFPAHFAALAPYAQASFGVARTDAGYTTYQTNTGTSFSDGRVVIDHGFAYQGLVGLDIHALPVLDVRLIELGIGGISGVQNQPGSHLLESIGIGLVFHLPY